ncbi:MAG: preprotein translocase subunit YajC [Clostridia bacterium]|nr:preprotein translocase subunit YajC [Clostridia bacterium]
MGEWFASNSQWIMIVVLGVGLVAVMYFFSIRPQRKQEREQNEMRNSLAVGDEITTIGGIIGKVVSIRDETLVLETSHDRTRIRILKSAIRSIDVKVDAPDDTTSK